MCYGMNCGREGAMGTCSNPLNCILRDMAMTEEEHFAAQQRRDALFAEARLLCPNCLGQGERRELAYADGLFTCPECEAVCDPEELLDTYEYVKATCLADAPTVDAFIATLAQGRAA